MDIVIQNDHHQSADIAVNVSCVKKKNTEKKNMWRKQYEPRVHWRHDHWFSGGEVIITAMRDARGATGAMTRYGIAEVTTTHQLQQRPRQRYIHQPGILDKGIHTFKHLIG